MLPEHPDLWTGGSSSSVHDHEELPAGYSWQHSASTIYLHFSLKMGMRPTSQSRQDTRQRRACGGLLQLQANKLERAQNARKYSSKWTAPFLRRPVQPRRQVCRCRRGHLGKPGLPPARFPRLAASTQEVQQEMEQNQAKGLLNHVGLVVEVLLPQRVLV